MFSNDESNNPSSNPSMQDVIDTCNHQRRTLLKGSIGVATWAAFGGMGLSTGALANGGHGGNAAAPLIGFTPVSANTLPMTDMVSVPVGYSARVFVAWGDALSHGTNWDPATEMTEAQQLGSYGAHTDGMHFFPFPAEPARAGNMHGLLVSNSEYNDPGLVHATPSYSSDEMTAERVDTQLAAHGVNVVEALRPARKGDWKIKRPSRLARRITGKTPMTLSGPAAGHAMLQTPADPSGMRVLGTLNNCANGYTPWGTYLTCEENFNGYFGTTDAAFVQTPHEKRYGVSKGGFGYRWHEADPRFDLRAGGQVSNEPNRFGWVVEIDPFDPKSTPVKRTALGRFKHEGAWVVVDDNDNLAVYMGDDERFEYVYKFVSARPFDKHCGQRRMKARHRDMLDHGTLYAARFNADGSGEWLALVHGENGLTAANGFADQGEVLIRARAAADLLGATKMDRPEWGAVHPHSREVYMTMTNNTARSAAQIDAANPRAKNTHGHIIRWREAGNRVTATAFEWDLFVQAGDSSDANPDLQGNINGDDYGSPDGLWFDRDGRLWIQTDQAGTATGAYANIGGNVMLCADVASGETRRFLTAPPNAEVTGVTSTPDGKSMFVGIQHPGEDWTAGFTENSSWPDNGANGPTTASASGPAKPRSAVVVITKNDGGVIGS